MYRIFSEVGPPWHLAMRVRSECSRARRHTRTRICMTSRNDEWYAEVQCLYKGSLCELVVNGTSPLRRYHNLKSCITTWSVAKIILLINTLHEAPYPRNSL